VWPDPDGEVRGQAFLPLYKSVPKAADEDEKLHELAALVDALRSGNARERNIAAITAWKQGGQRAPHKPLLHRAMRLIRHQSI
jgi:hypothetical protein